MQPTFSWSTAADLKAALKLTTIPLALKDAWYSYFDTATRTRVAFHSDIYEQIKTVPFLLRETLEKGPKGPYKQFIICLPTENKPDAYL